jgi:hypothetical protein
MQQAFISSLLDNRPEGGWRQLAVASASVRATNRYVFRAISHHSREGFSKIADSDVITGGVEHVASFITAIDPTGAQVLFREILKVANIPHTSEMLTDIVVRAICNCLGPTYLLALAEISEKQGQYKQSAQFFACASLAGW